MQDATQAKIQINRSQLIKSLGVGILLLLVLAFAMSSENSNNAIFWLVGLTFGVIIQRSRFCFTAAFRDLFLLGQTRMMKGVLIGLAVCTVGFAMVMSNVYPNPGFGSPPVDANIIPVGLSTLIAGTLFGVGMVLAGGCVSGSSTVGTVARGDET